MSWLEIDGEGYRGYNRLDLMIDVAMVWMLLRDGAKIGGILVVGQVVADVNGTLMLELGVQGLLSWGRRGEIPYRRWECGCDDSVSLERDVVMDGMDNSGGLRLVVVQAVRRDAH